MKVSIPKETAPGERRVALVPDVAKRLAPKGIDFVVEPGAGEPSHISDAAYEEAGVKVEAGAGFSGDVVAKVVAPTADEIAKLSSNSVLIGFLNPLSDAATAKGLAASGATSFAVEAIPRISRAQSMDALSSQATVTGYRASLIAAQELPRFFPMLSTAAGTIRPAQILVLGAGVAGLQAIATSKRLGGVIHAFDVRSAVKEQIESLGAKFVELDIGLEDAEDAGGYARALTDEEQQRQREALADVIARMDGVISTAAVPGRKAPLLIIEDAVKRMKPGSVIVDLAAETGGNCELTESGQTVVRHDVKIIGPENLASSMPDHASQLYSNNIRSILELMVGEEGALELDFEDEIISGACLTKGGEIVNERAKQVAGA